MTDTAIDTAFAWEALDSRGKPTVACEITLRDGSTGQVTVPSGASTGRHEARELRDGGLRYDGNGVRHAVGNVNTVLAESVRGIDALDQAQVDAALRAVDGSDDLGRLGANATLAVSIGTAIAAAAAQHLPLYRTMDDTGRAPLLPLPMVNILSGGAHAGRSIDVQDFLVVPMSATSFADAIEVCSRVRRGATQVLAERDLPVALVADEGGLGPILPSNRAALDVMMAAIERAGLIPGADAAIAIDVAATQFHSAGDYVLTAENGRHLTSAELIDELADWSDNYPIVSLEDALAEDDWDGWALATARLGGVQLLGDDLFVTNERRLRRGVTDGVANAVLVKPNQIGTLTDARSVVAIAHAAGYRTVLSARSGETEDSWLADLAVGWRTGQIKVGSTMRSERTAKWNRLLRLEAELGTAAEYAGSAAITTAPHPVVSAL